MNDKPKKKPGAAAHRQAQAKYTAAMREAGYSQRHLWVPPFGHEDYDKAVTALKKKWDRQA